MMKLIKINDGYINADKIIQIYERPINPNDSDSALVTVIELEGFGTGNTGPYGELPYYYQNEVVTKEPLKEVIKLIYCLTEALGSIKGLYEENRIEDKENAEQLIDSYKYAIELLMKEEVE